MDQEDRIDLVSHFAELKDPREQQNREHQIIDIQACTGTFRSSCIQH